MRARYAVPWALVSLLLAVGAAAQQSAATRNVVVGGKPMRVKIAGLAERKPGAPIVVLESGAGEDGIEPWAPVFDRLAEIGPVLSYDRRGIGGSAPDTQAPTFRRVAESLHDLLQQLGAAPPYVLVGQSWGGLFVRAFAGAYPREVRGLVFLDVTDYESTPQEKAAVLPPADRHFAFDPPDLPEIPANTPAGLRAEFEQVLSEMRNNYSQARALGSFPDVPIAVVVATPPARMVGNSGLMVRLQMRHQADWTFNSAKGVFIAASHVGHMVQRDDPDLVVRLVRHVMEH